MIEDKCPVGEHSEVKSRLLTLESANVDRLTQERDIWREVSRRPRTTIIATIMVITVTIVSTIFSLIVSNFNSDIEALDRFTAEKFKVIEENKKDAKIEIELLKSMASEMKTDLAIIKKEVTKK